MFIQSPQPEPEIAGRGPFQFTIRELLAATFFLSVGLSFIATFGASFAPCVFGVLAASIGYWLTIRRNFDVAG